MEAQRVAGLPRVKRKGLCGRFLAGSVVVFLLFRGGLLGAVQLQNRVDPDLPDGCFESVFLLSYSRLRSSPSTWI